MAQTALEKGQQFLKENGKKEGVTTTPSGLQYKVLRDGTGRQPKKTDTVEVHYEGRLIEGTIFDSSYQRRESIEFPLNGVIAGWTEGVALMKEGAKYQLYIPSELAYGSMGAGGDIGAGRDFDFRCRTNQGSVAVVLKVYTYAKCSTCRKAVKFLRDHQIPFAELPIRETPPSLTELRSMREGRSVKALFNTSGLDYKALGLSSKLSQMSEAAALGLMAKNGNLVKRPFVIGKNVRLVGFDEEAWGIALG